MFTELRQKYLPGQSILFNTNYSQQYDLPHLRLSELAFGLPCSLGVEHDPGQTGNVVILQTSELCYELTQNRNTVVSQISSEHVF